MNNTFELVAEVLVMTPTQRHAYAKARLTPSQDIIAETSFKQNLCGIMEAADPSLHMTWALRKAGSNAQMHAAIQMMILARASIVQGDR